MQNPFPNPLHKTCLSKKTFCNASFFTLKLRCFTFDVIAMPKHIILRVCAAVCLLALTFATLPQSASALVDGDVSYPANQTVASGATVSLSVSVNPNIGVVLNWQRMDATGLTLSNVIGISSSTLSFNAPVLARNSVSQTFSFRLTVFDGQTVVFRDVSILVSLPQNTVPSENAGTAQNVFAGDEVFFGR